MRKRTRKRKKRRRKKRTRREHLLKVRLMFDLSASFLDQPG